MSFFTSASENKISAKRNTLPSRGAFNQQFHACMLVGPHFGGFAPQWEINFGLGVGMTRSTDHLIAKVILGYRFSF